MTDDISYEAALLKRIAQGDEIAFQEIFDRYKGSFYEVAMKMTRSDVVSQEIVQEAFVSLWQQRACLMTVDQPSAYLFSVVYHRVYRYFKSRAKQRQLKQDVLARTQEGENTTEDLLSYKESERNLQDIISQLPDQQQLIYKLSKQEGLAREEIAERLRISPNTVRNHLLRAVKYIRTQFHHSFLFLTGFFL